MGSSSKAKQEVADYYLSLHIGVCQEADAVTGLFYGEKLMWEGEQAEAGAFVVNKKSLFGGPKKEGGVYGSVLVLPGDENQVLPQAMTRRWGVEDPSQTPAYRGMMSLFFCGYTQEFEDDEPDPDPDPPPEPVLADFCAGTGVMSMEANICAQFYAPGLVRDVYSLGVNHFGREEAYARATDPSCSGKGAYSHFYWAEEVYESNLPVTSPRIDIRVGYCATIDPCAEGWPHEGLDETCPPTYCRPGWVDAGPGSNPRCVYPDLTDVTTFSSPRKGFYWSSNTPYLRDIWVRVRRMPRGLSANAIGDDANPAGIIYEVCTSARFGMGVPDDLMDVQSFQACADTLFDEGLGLSMVMSNPSEADEFLNTVLDHIDGVLFTHPRTGKHTLKLIRGDYDAETLRAINPDNAKMVSFQRRGWGETANEITTTWTNPENEQEETVTLQDMGNITQQQGTVIADTRNYFGVRSSALAIELCARELRKAAYPTASCEIKVLREGWDLVPADVVKLYWPDYGADNVVMRISEVDYGDRSSPWITIRMVEDIFSLPLTSYTVPPSSGWVDTSEEPEPLAHKYFFSLPAYFEYMLNGISVSSLTELDASLGVLGASTQEDAYGFDLMEIVTLPDGGKAWDVTGSKDLMGHAVLQNDLPAEARSEIPAFTDHVGDYEASASMFLMFVAAGESDNDSWNTKVELALVSYDDAGDLILLRGVLDTVPHDFSAGDEVWFIPPDANIVADDRQTIGTRYVRMLTSTSLGTLAKEDAPREYATVFPRSSRPNRPANVKVGGTAFGTHVSEDGLDLEVTWARRNRLTEEGMVLSWDDGDMTPEANQKTSVRVTDSSGNVLADFLGLDGTSCTVPLSTFSGGPRGEILVVSYFPEEGTTDVGLVSYQGHRIEVLVVPVGAFASEEGVYFEAENGTEDFLEME